MCQDVVIGSVGKVAQALSLSLRTVGMEGGLGDDVRAASTYVKRHPAGEFLVLGTELGPVSGNQGTPFAI